MSTASAASAISSSTDLNDIIQPGSYEQTSSSPSLALNYPESSRGTLTVVSTGASNSLIEQRYVTTGTTSVAGNEYFRTRNTLASGWSPWQFVAGSGTGWVNLTSYRVSGSNSVWFEGQKRGDDVILRGQIERSGGFSTGDNITRALPSMWRPGNNTQGPAWFSGSVPGIVWIRPDGTMAVAHSGSSNRGSVQFTLGYTV